MWVDDTWIEGTRNKANTTIAQLAARLPRALVLVRKGTPRSTILEVSSELKADLVVMGTHGRTGLAHVLLGSVAEYVVRYSRGSPC